VYEFQVRERYGGSKAFGHVRMQARTYRLKLLPWRNCRSSLNAQWVKPQLTARVRHLSGSDYLRHATVRTIDN